MEAAHEKARCYGKKAGLSKEDIDGAIARAERISEYLKACLEREIDTKDLREATQYILNTLTPYISEDSDELLNDPRHLAGALMEIIVAIDTLQTPAIQTDAGLPVFASLFMRALKVAAEQSFKPKGKRA